MLLQALNIHKTILGEDHPDVAVTMNNLGVLLTHIGRLDEAKQLLEKVVDIRTKKFGEDNHYTICAKQVIC